MCVIVTHNVTRIARMQSVNVPADLVAEAMAIVGSTKSAVLGEGTVIGGRPLVPGEEPLTVGNRNYDSWLPVTEIDARDERTPDNWIPRWSSLIRLTGKHPLNAEPPHLDLMDAGWLTPVSKHFVRSHGAVPKLDWASHRIHVTGMVDKELVLSMEDILKLEPITIPVLLTCSGNRRQEMNAEKKTQCFPYGPCAVAVNWWTGTRMSDILKMAGCKQYKDGARYVPSEIMLSSSTRCLQYHTVTLCLKYSRLKSGMFPTSSGPKEYQQSHAFTVTRC